MDSALICVADSSLWILCQSFVLESKCFNPLTRVLDFMLDSALIHARFFSFLDSALESLLESRSSV